MGIKADPNQLVRVYCFSSSPFLSFCTSSEALSPSFLFLFMNPRWGGGSFIRITLSLTLWPSSSMLACSLSFSPSVVRNTRL